MTFQTSLTFHPENNMPYQIDPYKTTIRRLPPSPKTLNHGTLPALLGQLNQSFDAFCQIVAALLLTQQDAPTQTALEQITSQSKKTQRPT